MLSTPHHPTVAAPSAPPTAPRPAGPVLMSRKGSSKGGKKKVKPASAQVPLAVLALPQPFASALSVPDPTMLPIQTHPAAPRFYDPATPHHSFPFHKRPPLQRPFPPRSAAVAMPPGLSLRSLAPREPPMLLTNASRDSLAGEVAKAVELEVAPDNGLTHVREKRDSKMAINRIDPAVDERSPRFGLRHMTVSAMLPTSLYGGLLEEILKSLEWELCGLSRVLNDRNQRWAMHLDLRKKSTSVPLTPTEGLATLVSYVHRTAMSAALAVSDADRSRLRGATVRDLFEVSPDPEAPFVGPVHHQYYHPRYESSYLQLAKPIARIFRMSALFTHKELPQIVHIAARVDFAVSLLKKLLEPCPLPTPPTTRSGRPSPVPADQHHPQYPHQHPTQQPVAPRCELIGIKHVAQELDVAHAERLVPFAVGTEEWEKGIQELIKKPAEGSGGWMFILVRRVNGYEEVGKIVDAYVDSYKSLARPSPESVPEFGRRTQRRRGGSAESARALTAPEPEEDLRLKVIVSPNVDVCFWHATVFFYDYEIFSSEAWPDQEFHPPLFFENFGQPIVRAMTTPLPYLTTVCIIKASLFPHLGKLLGLIAREGFIVSGMRIMRISTALARTLLGDEAYAARKWSSDERDGFVADVTAGPVLVFSLQRVNAVKRWLDVLAEVHSRTGAAHSNSRLMHNGIFAPPNYLLAE
ncbi:hypothetical protein BDK51DRAFT_34111, partial [Blyttiomyces helicus]